MFVMRRSTYLVDQATVYGELVAHENTDDADYNNPLTIQASDGFIVKTVNKVSYIGLSSRDGDLWRSKIYRFVSFCPPSPYIP